MLNVDEITRDHFFFCHSSKIQSILDKLEFPRIATGRYLKHGNVFSLYVKTDRLQRVLSVLLPELKEMEIEVGNEAERIEG